MIDRQRILRTFSFSPFAPNFAESDLLLLNSYARGSTFVIETGAGISTHYIADGARDTCSLMYSIDIRLPPNAARVDWVSYVEGWSMNPSDLLRPGDAQFLKSRYVSPEDHVVFKGAKQFDDQRSTGVLGTVLAGHPNRRPDFVFSDGGEYSGYPEWVLLKDVIQVGGIWASHDIHYPKSVKHVLSTKEVDESPEWEVLAKTDSRQGLLIARRVADGS